MTEEILIVKQVASILQCSVAQVRKLILQGKIAAFSIDGGGKQKCFRVTRSALDRFIQQNQSPLTSATVETLPPEHPSPLRAPPKLGRSHMAEEILRLRRRQNSNGTNAEDQ